MMLLFSLLSTSFFSQKKESFKSYEFTIYDGPESSTMNQFSKNYLSSYRMFSRTLDELISNETINMGVKFLSITLFGQPKTHEEGHRYLF